MPASRRTRVILVGAAVALVLAAVPAVLWLTGSAAPPAAHVADLAVGPTSSARPAPTLAASPSTQAAAPTETSAGTSAVPSVKATPRPVTRPRVVADAPAEVRIGAIGVDSVVVPVGVDDQGAMEVPRDVRTIGWYSFGARPGGKAGSAVLSGHVDDRVQGRGAFYSLSNLTVGDRVEVEMGDGATFGYRVTRVERITKDVLPVERIFARGGSPHLTLVTCGGDFDRATRNYVDNVVVTAEPVS